MKKLFLQTLSLLLTASLLFTQCSKSSKASQSSGNEQVVSQWSITVEGNKNIVCVWQGSSSFTLTRL